MATNNSGVLGTFIGTIGPVTGFVRNGKNIVRSSRSSIKNKRTPLQLAQREKIRVCNIFTTAFSGTGFFNKSFPAYGHTGTGFNRVTGALMNQAITGAYPHITLNYARVLISKGSLPGAVASKVAIKPKGVLQFSFADNSLDGTARPDDTVVLVAYVPALRHAIFTLNGGSRKDARAVLNVAAFKGYSIETWIGYLSKDGEDASDSVYTGRLDV